MVLVLFLGWPGEGHLRLLDEWWEQNATTGSIFGHISSTGWRGSLSQCVAVTQPAGREGKQSFRKKERIPKALR
jgi:hypothetical protein